MMMLKNIVVDKWFARPRVWRRVHGVRASCLKIGDGHPHEPVALTGRTGTPTGFPVSLNVTSPAAVAERVALNTILFAET